MLAYRVVPMRGPAGNLAATLEIMKMTDTSIFTCSSAKNEARLKQWDFFFFSAGCGSPGLGEEGRLEALGEGCLSSLTQCCEQASLSVHT